MVDKTLIMSDGETAIANPIPEIQKQLDNHNKSLYNINDNIQTMETEIDRMHESIHNLGSEIYNDRHVYNEQFENVNTFETMLNSSQIELEKELARTNELLMDEVRKLYKLKNVVYILCFIFVGLFIALGITIW